MGKFVTLHNGTPRSRHSIKMFSPHKGQGLHWGRVEGSHIPTPTPPCLVWEQPSEVLWHSVITDSFCTDVTQTGHGPKAPERCLSAADKPNHNQRFKKKRTKTNWTLDRVQQQSSASCLSRMAQTVRRAIFSTHFLQGRFQPHTYHTNSRSFGSGTPHPKQELQPTSRRYSITGRDFFFSPLP